MNKDSPDTFVMEDASEWEATQVDDVFLPSVQVQLGWREVEAAVARGAIVPTQAHALWAAWAAPGSPLRRGVGSVERAYQSTQAEPAWMEERAERDGSPGGARLMAFAALLAGIAIGAGLMVALSR